MTALLVVITMFTWACESQDLPEPAPEVSLQEEPEQEDRLHIDGELLGALGYVEWSEDLDDESKTLSSVVRIDAAKSQPGLNLYSSKSQDGSQCTYLIDASGDILHQWLS